MGLNSDAWLTRKKGKPFMPFVERQAVLEAIKWVDRVYAFDDSDDTAIDAIRYMRDYFFYADLIFANGGDRTSVNIPEMNCGIDRVEFVFSVGGDDKKNSSSWILKQWENNGV